MPSKNTRKILSFIQNNPSLSSKEIHNGLGVKMGYTSLKRVLVKLKAEKLIEITGRGRGTKYIIGAHYQLFLPIEIHEYFKKEVDEREIIDSFNLSLINKLREVELFTIEELAKLIGLQKEFIENVSKLTEAQYKKEFERLAIDLCWKSSQIEGNTYSLLETERLLKEKKTASGKTKDEAVMLLNHKEAIDFIIENPTFIYPLKVSSIEDIHSILIKELGVKRNIRTRRVGITGTNYRPLDNEYQIKEALMEMCDLVSSKKSVFEKSFLLLVLISYIQAFDDGNKRTARIISNAMLVSNNYCPISFRTIDSVQYKKAMLLFYEQNNIALLKEIFINQFEFAIKKYF